MNFVLYYVCVMNTVAFLLMKIDKQRAKKNQWRVPEKTLFLVSLLGGSFGAWCGMYIWHHKTKHIQFQMLFPFIFFAHVALILYLDQHNIFHLFQ